MQSTFPFSSKLLQVWKKSHHCLNVTVTGSYFIVYALTFAYSNFLVSVKYHHHIRETEKRFCFCRVCMCVLMCKQVYMSADACRAQRRMSESLELHSQAG